MQLSNFIKSQKNLAKVRSSDSIEAAAKKMKEFHCGDVIVEEDEKPVGILTDRDIVIRCIAETRNIASTKLKEVMSKSPNCLKLEQSGRDALNKMKEEGVSRIVVVDSSNKAQGIVTADHILKYISQELDDLSQLSEEMIEHEKQAA